MESEFQSIRSVVSISLSSSWLQAMQPLSHVEITQHLIRKTRFGLWYSWHYTNYIQAMSFRAKWRRALGKKNIRTLLWKQQHFQSLLLWTLELETENRKCAEKNWTLWQCWQKILSCEEQAAILALHQDGKNLNDISIKIPASWPRFSALQNAVSSRKAKEME